MAKFTKEQIDLITAHIDEAHKNNQRVCLGLSMNNLYGMEEGTEYCYIDKPNENEPNSITVYPVDWYMEGNIRELLYDDSLSFGLEHMTQDEINVFVRETIDPIHLLDVQLVVKCMYDGETPETADYMQVSIRAKREALPRQYVAILAFDQTKNAYVTVASHA